ncbi:MAG: PAS domain-containing protein [Ktedonobacteraceae bacterium]|nr:PAS domain-containing protein [Ktedonobacteraceae bacterium]
MALHFYEKKEPPLRVEGEIYALVDALPQLVWIARPDGYVTYNNQRLIDYLAMTLEQVEGDGWLAGVHPDDRQRAQEAWQSAIQTSIPYEAELRLQNGASGVYRWFLVRGVPRRNAQDTILHWVGTCTDIDEQKHIEQALRESREELFLVMETIPQLVWLARPDGFLEYSNQRVVTYLNVPLEQFNGDQWFSFIHPDDRQKTRTSWQTALRTGQSHEVEYRLREGKTGNYRWFLVRGTPFTDAKGRILKWFGTCTDIDEQKRTEEALRQSQERMSILMTSNIIGISVIEGDQMVDANDTFLRMTGYTREDLRAGSMNWKHMTPPEYLARSQQAHQELAMQQWMAPYEKEYICKDGSRLSVVVGAVVIQQHPFQAIAFVLDNSAHHELEQRKDDFISMASHELRNPLTALKLQMALLHRQLAKQGIQASELALSRMEIQINTITRFVEEMLDISKIRAGSLEYIQELVDLDTLLREIADNMQHSHPSHTIVIRGALQASLMGDRDRLGQVFSNLLSNAIKYSPNAQIVEMDLDTSSEAVTISVHDHGLGIPQEQREKIFERFYRAAGPRQQAIPGLGMGLYIVAEIIKHHGGTITVDSTVGEGSTFTVTLPRERNA